MKAIEQLKQFLDGQLKSGVKSQDWHKLDYETTADGFGNTDFDIPSLEVIFVFSKTGKLTGAFNYKE